MDSDYDWEERPWLERYYWTRFTSLEVEEIKCVYFLLYSLLVNFRYCHLPTTDYKAPSANFRHREISKQRGLPLLYQILSGGHVSVLAKSYVYNFVDYAFRGLGRADLYDSSTFPPEEVLGHKRPVKKRYEPSETLRVENFGVQKSTRWWAEHRKEKREAERKKSDRTVWRLIGWCFWDQERVASVMNGWDLRFSGLRQGLADLVLERIRELESGIDDASTHEH